MILLITVAGDVPKWTDVGIFWATAGSGAVLLATAIFAGLAFRQQNKQVKALEAKQGLYDQILAYQAHRYARTFTENVKFVFSHAADFTTLSANLMNESAWSVADIRAVALVDGMARDADTTYKLIYNTNAPPALRDWVQQRAPLRADEANVLNPNEGRVWNWAVRSALRYSTFEVAVRFTDEVGGRWEFREDGLIRLIANSDW